MRGGFVNAVVPVVLQLPYLPLSCGLTLVQDKPKLPHVLLILADDLVWTNGEKTCVQFSELVLLSICKMYQNVVDVPAADRRLRSPTRSSLQTGRLQRQSHHLQRFVVYRNGSGYTS